MPTPGSSDIGSDGSIGGSRQVITWIARDRQRSGNRSLAVLRKCVFQRIWRLSAFNASNSGVMVLIPRSAAPSGSADVARISNPRHSFVRFATKKRACEKKFFLNHLSKKKRPRKVNGSISRLPPKSKLHPKTNRIRSSQRFCPANPVDGGRLALGRRRFAFFLTNL